MAEGTRGLTMTNGNAGGEATPRQTVQRLGGEIAAVRQELDTLLAEADRRRHDVMDVRLQIRRHAPGAALTVIAVLGAIAPLLWFGTRHRRQRRGLTAKARRLRHAVSRMVDQPDRVAAEPTMAGKIALAAGNAAVAVLIKKLLERGIEHILDAPSSGSQLTQHHSNTDVGGGTHWLRGA